MIDIASTLQRAAQKRKSWTNAAAHDLAMHLASNSPYSVDWDSGAGETWLRITDHAQAIALVSVILPLTIVKSDAFFPPRELADVEVISVTDLDAPVLRCRKDILDESFGASSRYGTIDVSRFSANDLWYTTV